MPAPASARKPEHHYSLGEMIDFIVSPELGVTSPFRVSEAKAACELILDAAREYERTVFAHESVATRRSGPCIGCLKHISYLGFTGFHKRHGDRWLDKVIHVAEEQNGKYVWRGGDIYIAGKSWHIVKNYACEECSAAVKEIISRKKAEDRSASDQESARRREQQESSRVENTAWLITEPDSSDGPRWIESAYWSRLSNYDPDALAALPYRSGFLKSRYWAMVRRQTLKRFHYKCSICAASKTTLNVHHKTYEHHGQEDSFPEDLTVLCYSCHQKFHDKLAAPPENA